MCVSSPTASHLSLVLSHTIRDTACPLALYILELTGECGHRIHSTATPTPSILHHISSQTRHQRPSQDRFVLLPCPVLCSVVAALQDRAPGHPCPVTVSARHINKELSTNLLLFCKLNDKCFFLEIFSSKIIKLTD